MRFIHSGSLVAYSLGFLRRIFGTLRILLPAWWSPYVGYSSERCLLTRLREFYLQAFSDYRTLITYYSMLALSR